MILHATSHQLTFFQTWLFNKGKYADQWYASAWYIPHNLLLCLYRVIVVTACKMARTPARNANAPQDQQPPGKKGSPKKAGKDRLQIKVTSTKQARRIAYLFKILKLAADIEVIWCEKSPRDDAFLYPLVKNIEGVNQFGNEGVIAVTHRRISRTDNSVLFNANDSSYPRRLIVRTIDESTPESRRAILMLFRDFMMRPENNRFGYEYVVDNTSDVFVRWYAWAS